MPKTIQEINEKIKAGKAVVLDAEEMIQAVQDLGVKKAAETVDVVTTGTFSPMCSSGMLFNFGQEPPTIKASSVSLNSVSAYGGLAAVDAYLGATELPKDDPLNKVYPGQFKYGGGHVIEDLVAGKQVRLKAKGYGTDCYPRRELEKLVTLADLPSAQLLNPRNGYQSYNVAVNLGSKIIYTYMGPVKAKLRNANYATAGCLSPLFNDPLFKTIGLGTKIFLGGGVGWVLGAGTQHNPSPKRTERGIPLSAAGTLMVRGDMKGMQPRYLRGVSFVGYGCSLAVGLGIPIPILNEEMAFYTSVRDEDIPMPVKDYSHDYPQGVPRVLKHVTYAELKTGTIEVEGKSVAAVPLTSWVLSKEIAQTLKQWIQGGQFTLTEAQELLPAG
ncbi:homocysteine biosynthesis protein [Megalodesulfovibrio paquesii]